MAFFCNYILFQVYVWHRSNLCNKNGRQKVDDTDICFAFPASANNEVQTFIF